MVKWDDHPRGLCKEEKLRLKEEERLRKEEETCLQKEGGFPGSQIIKKHDPKKILWGHALPLKALIVSPNDTKSAVNFNLST